MYPITAGCSSPLAAKVGCRFLPKWILGTSRYQSSTPNNNNSSRGEDQRRPDYSVATFKPNRASKWTSGTDTNSSYLTRKRLSGGGYDGGHYHRQTAIEIPVSSVLILMVSGFVWYITRNHQLMENEISFRTFINELLPNNSVERLEVVNKEFVRVILKSGANVNDIISKDNQKKPKVELSKVDLYVMNLAKTKVGKLISDSLLIDNNLSRGGNIVCFEVGDCSKLETLIQKVSSSTRHSSSIPPIVYRQETDVIGLIRAYIPSVVLTALAFSTFTQHSSPLQPGFGHQISQAGAATSSHDKLLRFGKAFPVLGKDVPKVTFSDVAGLEQAKKEVSEFVEFLRMPKKFIDLGAELPKGALLVGPPGTGKTLLARAVAGEANVPFYSMSGSDFIELFVGVGPSRIRDLFDRARRNAPAIVFIDEIDTIGRSRAPAGAPGNGGTDERESTLNALLVEMDGFTTRSGVVILAGTNRGDVLDPALTRPGRFDRQIALGKPSVRERKAIFDIYLRPIKMDEEEDRNEVSRRLAALTPGLTGAEIKSVCNEAAILAARKNALSVSMEHFEASVERLVGGLQKTGEVLTTHLKRHVALHEAGHAVAGWFLRYADPVLKISIVPRASGSLGYTQLLPDDILLVPREELLTKVCVLLGGRASELLFAGGVTTGAADDLTKATALVHSFVSQLGLDEVMGLAAYPSSHSQSLLQPRLYSEATAQRIDERVNIIIDQQWERCLKLLKEKEAEVKMVADLLLERETISFADLKELLGDPPGDMKESLRQFVEALPRRKTEIVELS